ncbi:hypothetical protein AAEU32_10885 [Pseudoalteromonas sp. SSDWG2]|uniref:hypothetical protein n=1 Tax=Pseudoalteromonas sp. SSDWG2 TaxID=3139391 RepID=UPI003BA9CFDC
MKAKLSLALATLFLGACSSTVTLDDIVPAEEVNKPLYLRGDFSLWDAQPEYQMQKVAPAIYETKINLSTPGKAYEFKIADANWSENYNCGYLDEGLDKQLEIGLPVQADCNSVYNYFSFTPAEEGWYKISINFSRFSKPLVTVNQVFE